MNKKAILALEDGTIYQGHSFGADTTAYGEVVFDAAMTGYQEMITDPSFAGGSQIFNVKPLQEYLTRAG